MSGFFGSKDDSNMPTRFDFELVSMSSYCESSVKDTASKIDKRNILFPIACQLAIVGWGCKTFGVVKVAGEEIDIKEYFQEIGVIWNSSRDDQISEGDLTPKRIVRIFRFEISEWLLSYKGESFLVRKYGGRAVRKYKAFMFPGSEYLVEEKHHVEALLLCYQKMDSVRGTDFSGRIQNILSIRGLI